MAEQEIGFSSTLIAMPKKIAIIGAGLAGTAVARLLWQTGADVSIFEKRPNLLLDTETEEITPNPFGRAASSSRRSINLALSYRGQVALTEMGLWETVMKMSIAMRSRIIHDLKGKIDEQPYGNPGQCIWSVSRLFLNKTLLHAVMDVSSDRMRINYDHTLVTLDPNGHCTFQLPSKKLVTHDFDLVIGADGAFSATRECMLRHGRINFQREFIGHGYKELCIPAKILANGETDFALSPVEGLHIWPRGQFMLIALPNQDKSFTATLFAPYDGEEGAFSQIPLLDDVAIMSHFQKHFPDILPIAPFVCQDFRLNPVGSLATIKVNPWNLNDKILLIGDAAHAVVPFFGQGANAAFEDALRLFEVFNETKDLSSAVIQFSSLRRPSTDALAYLSLRNYTEMASHTTSKSYVVKKAFESFVSRLMPSKFMPLYSMVSFSDIPYHKVVQKDIAQQKLLRRLGKFGAALFGIGLALVFAKLSDS